MVIYPPRFVVNKDKNRIEIYFSQKPKIEILTELKKNKWIWSPLNKCWYSQINNLNYNFAKKICFPEIINYKEKKINEIEKLINIPSSIRRKLLNFNINQFVIIIGRIEQYCHQFGTPTYRDVEKIIELDSFSFIIWLNNKIKQKELEEEIKRKRIEEEKRLYEIINLCSRYGVKLSKYFAKNINDMHLSLTALETRLTTIKYYNERYVKVNMGAKCLMMSDKEFHDYLFYLEGIFGNK